MVKYILEWKLNSHVQTIYLNKISPFDGKIVAACDKERIGKRFEEGKLSLDLEKSARFYKGKLSTEEELKKAMQDANSINLVGEKAVKAAVDAGMIKDSAVKKIAGIPHIQMYRVKSTTPH